MFELNEVRYAIALVLVVLVPMVIAFWLVIHLGTPIWRRYRGLVAYSCAGIILALVGTFAWFQRTFLIGNDWGTNWLLFGAGLLIYLASLRMALPVRRYLSFSTFAGMPEITDKPIQLITEGPYAIIRHPRYLMVLVGIVGWAMMANFQAAYVTSAACMVGLWGIIQLEERELKARFGKAYDRYSQDVPQVIPKMGDWLSF